MFKRVKKFLTNSKSKVVVMTVTFCLALSMCPAVFAAETDSGADLSGISTAIQTAINSAVGIGVSLLISLIPVALQLISGFALFKLGKKYFGQFMTG